MAFDQVFGAISQPIETDRYRLLWATVCPFAQRPVIARELLGLDDKISLGTVNSVRGEEGWSFTLDEGEVDSVLGIHLLKEAYLKAVPNYIGPYSVPSLVDIESGKVVRFESLEVLRDFTTNFKPLHGEGTLDLYPGELAAEIDKWNDIISDRLLMDAYKANFVESKDEKQSYITRYYKFLEGMEERLAEKRYFHGNKLTETDIVVYTALVRFESIYHDKYGFTGRNITDYPNLWSYMRELYQIPAFKNTTDFHQYFLGYDDLEQEAAYDVSKWDTTHQRGDM